MSWRDEVDPVFSLYLQCGESLSSFHPCCLALLRAAGRVSITSGYGIISTLVTSILGHTDHALEVSSPVPKNYCHLDRMK